MGTSIFTPFFLLVREDHPHAYGDKTQIKVMKRLNLGSSPRVWGQGCSVKTSIMRSRIIPTRMGTSGFFSSSSSSDEDHPHAYGDKKCVCYGCRRTRGSSPRVWGQVLWYAMLAVVTGIIPTRMGTSDEKMRPHTLCQGSSPRVWGQETALTV